MAQFFVMPQASPTMTVGVVGKWLVAEGATLSPSQAIASVETDKATMEIEVFDKGVLLKQLAAEGQEVPPGMPIAIIGSSAGEDTSALVAEYAAMMAAPAAAGPAPAPAAVPAPVAPPAPMAAPAAAPVPVAAPPAPPRPAGEPGRSEPVMWDGRPVDASFMEARAPFRPPTPRVMASPLARQLAGELGVNLARVRATGPGGRIVAADVEAVRIREHCRVAICSADAQGQDASLGHRRTADLRVFCRRPVAQLVRAFHSQHFLYRTAGKRGIRAQTLEFFRVREQQVYGIGDQVAGGFMACVQQEDALVVEGMPGKTEALGLPAQQSREEVVVCIAQGATAALHQRVQECEHFSHCPVAGRETCLAQPELERPEDRERPAAQGAALLVWHAQHVPDDLDRNG